MATIHDGVYPVIPFSLLVVAVILAGDRVHHGSRFASRLAIPLFVSSIALTVPEQTAQLGRYFLFAAIAAYVSVLAYAVRPSRRRKRLVGSTS
jgi:hypothetical protein